MVNGAMRAGGTTTWTNGWLNVSAAHAAGCRAVLCCACMVCRDQLLLDQPDWDFDWFMSTQLSDYLIMSQEFMDEYNTELQQHAGSAPAEVGITLWFLPADSHMLYLSAVGPCWRGALVATVCVG